MERQVSVRRLHVPWLSTPVLIAVALSVVVAACAPGAAHSGADSAKGVTASATSADVVAEARAFMDAYARDLLAGDRAAVAARYDRTGVHMLGNGRKEFAPYDSVVARYQGSGWSPPRSFEWRDLSFEPVGPDAVVVAGRFLWGSAAGGAPVGLSYTSLLRRQDGVLRIRLEDESVDPSSVPAARPPADSARR
jgi:hypothetical protein